MNDYILFKHVFEDRIAKKYFMLYDKYDDDSDDSYLLDDVAEEYWTEFIEQYGIFFNEEDFERFTWYLDDKKIKDSKQSRFDFIELEKTQGHDFGYESDNLTPVK